MVSLDILGMIALFVIGAIILNFDNSSCSIVSEILLKIFGMLLETVAITYIIYKILKA